MVHDQPISGADLDRAQQRPPVTPPADGHVHSQWSWDAEDGAMNETCARAVALGIPAVSFTEHVDFTPFRAGFPVGTLGDLVTDGILVAPMLDVAGYLECVERCRARFPDLRIRTGMEVGQPHLHVAELDDLLSMGTFDRVIGSLHCLSDAETFAEPFELFRKRPAADVFREYLAEIPRMLAGSRIFGVLGHIDYPVRYWPEDVPAFEPADFEDELRHVLGALAATECALEINTELPLHETILGWWVESGGCRVTFGSDAHSPDVLGRGLAAAGAMAEAHGFRADRRPEDPWIS